MQVIVESSDPQAAQLRTLTKRRVRHALKRLAWLTPRVRVHLSDINGPRGGIDKRCHIELMTDGTNPVVVTSLAKDWFSARQSALTRATRALLQNWQRGRQTRASTLRLAAGSGCHFLPIGRQHEMPYVP
ncbi:MAG: HPF/RaiA family ribosome-associated protein [Polaromonas sp.]|nr:HPF/RaiA family ribosome-associated protein [Polaromonas sp.]